jgi:hypothetical protein
MEIARANKVCRRGLVTIGRQHEVNSVAFSEISARLLAYRQVSWETRQDGSTGSSIALQLVGDDPEWLLALTAQ